MSQASWQVYKCDNCGLKRPMEMIEMGKHLLFQGLVCNKDYHDVPRNSWYCIASELYLY